MSDIRFHAPPRIYRVAVEVEIATTMYPASTTMILGTDEQIARKAVEALLFETVDYDGEYDEQGPYRSCFGGRAKVRIPEGAGE